MIQKLFISFLIYWSYFLSEGGEKNLLVMGGPDFSGNVVVR